MVYEGIFLTILVISENLIFFMLACAFVFKTSYDRYFTDTVSETYEGSYSISKSKNQTSAHRLSISGLSKEESLTQSKLTEGLFYGQILLKRRETIVPNFKNYKNLKYYPQINQQYQIGREIGSGAFGKVLMVKKLSTGKFYAMKRIQKSEYKYKKNQDMLLSEMHVL